MSVLIKHMAMPKGCIYSNEKDQTEYCPLLNHDDVPFCQYIENEPESAIGIDERPVYCPLYDVPNLCEDAVSRQATIDVLDAYQVMVENGEENPYAWARLRMSELPSAQPEPQELSKNSTELDKENGELQPTCNKLATDCIGRQAAIDALYHVDEYNARSVEAIRNLPSAQPERTCLNCGRTANNGGWYADGRTRCPIEEHYALPKDGYCHLWEKRNVTDDDYPERREE